MNGATWILNFKIFKWAMGRRHGDTVREWWITTCLVLTEFAFDLGLFCFVLRFRRQLEKGFVRFCKCLSYFDYFFLSQWSMNWAFALFAMFYNVLLSHGSIENKSQIEMKVRLHGSRVGPTC